MDLAVNGARLRSDIETNAEFGAVDVSDGRARTVRTGTPANRRARDHLVDRMEAAGLEVRTDAVGNVAGRWEHPSATGAAPVAAGSHLDSVPEGGIFDGPLGVYAALEAIRTMRDADLRPDRPIEVVCFTEEEGGRFASGLLGSSVASGHRSVEEALELTDSDGVRLEDALETIGYRGDGRFDAANWDAWLELHIEQSDRLETAGVSAGVVTTITGITHCEVTIEGEANHAGSTPMSDRTDALAAASEFVLDIERAANQLVAEESPTAVGTVGSVDAAPNATNVVPGRVQLGLDVRDVESGSMNELVDRARRSLDRLERTRGVTTTLSRPFDLEPIPMADRCRDALHEAGDAHSVETVELHSGAAHDTMHVASVTDAGMLFAPSRDGISHSPLEWTDWDDCAAATTVLTGALAQLVEA
ncbi:Zn-dependent hydrolase [Natronorubrum texcoconense]|uniref:N-carbamoyl-L-amino-acid hydrolase n=1 Tax=Natronorubrum texcoconense TaxID=1095776 RepID=A0A1G9DC12_9EURY|nr:Zn-dependent hydrolase [Natronorubrum texcoconense]SDK61436.1 N-carbamoyl-L-amino-acid hydrolase [Natronorubrum texcoconense]